MQRLLFEDIQAGVGGGAKPLVVTHNAVPKNETVFSIWTFRDPMFNASETPVVGLGLLCMDSRFTESCADREYLQRVW